MLPVQWPSCCIQTTALLLVKFWVLMVRVLLDTVKLGVQRNMQHPDGCFTVMQVA